MAAFVGERRLDIGGLSLAAKEWGSEQTRRETPRRVLALHGWLDNANTFDHVAPMLEDVHLVALDMAGHGKSDHKPDPTSYHFIDYVPEVARAADALGWDRFTLLGHSLGAGVCLVLAGTVPERIERLALIEGLGPLTETDAGTPERLATAIRAEQKPVARKRIFENLDAAAEKLAQVTGQKVSTAKTLAMRSLHEVEGGWTWRSDSRLRQTSRLRLTEAQVLAFLGRVDCPTLLIGANDGIAFDRAVFDKRVDTMKDLTIEMLDGHHHLHLDDPEPTARTLNAFFSAGS